MNTKTPKAQNLLTITHTLDQLLLKTKHIPETLKEQIAAARNTSWKLYRQEIKNK